MVEVIDVPMTKKGAKIRRAMRKFYGKKKGDQVYFASVNKGTITGAEKGRRRRRR